MPEPEFNWTLDKTNGPSKPTEVAGANEEGNQPSLQLLPWRKVPLATIRVTSRVHRTCSGPYLPRTVNGEPHHRLCQGGCGIRSSMDLFLV